MLNHVLGVQIKLLDSRMGDIFPLPGYATDSAAGLDLRACLSSSLVLMANKVTLIPTGIAMHIENPFVTAMILPRSGLGHKNGIILGNSVGLIDADYQGELMISCWNRSTEDFTVNPGDRIAQLVFIPVVRADFEIVTEFLPSKRGEGGFGHTGKL